MPKIRFTDAHKYPNGYTKAVETDIGARFKLILKREKEFEKARAEAEKEDAEREALAKTNVVRPIKRWPT